MIVIDNKVEKSVCLDYINDCLVYIEDNYGDKFEMYVFQNEYGVYFVEFYILREYIEKLSDGELSSGILKRPFRVGPLDDKEDIEKYYHKKLYPIITSDLESLFEDVKSEFKSDKFNYKFETEAGGSSYVTWIPSIKITIDTNNKYVKTFEGWKYEIAEVSKNVIKDWKDKIEYILLPMMDELKVIKFIYDGNFQLELQFDVNDLDFVKEEVVKAFNYFEKLELDTEVYVRIINKFGASEYTKSFYTSNDIDEAFALLLNKYDKMSNNPCHFYMKINVSDPLDGEDEVRF